MVRTNPWTPASFQAAPQPGALFTADVYFTALENGAFNVDYWNTRNGMPEDNITTAPDGAAHYGDGNCNSQNVCEPALNTPFPPYYAFQMPSKVAGPGDTLVKSASDNPLLGPSITL